jgi:cation transport regulator ChaC
VGVQCREVGWGWCRAWAGAGQGRGGGAEPGLVAGLQESAHVTIGYRVPASDRKARRARPVGMRNRYCVVFFLINGLCPSLKRFP